MPCRFSCHVPRYNQLARELKKHGVDEILCVSVNEAFVMNEWQEDQQAWNMRFLPDANGEFTAGMGLLVEQQDLGFGRRSWRYSMLVKDGVSKKMLIETAKPGPPSTSRMPTPCCATSQPMRPSRST